MTDETLKRTTLYEEHVAAGAKLVPFAGYEMPVQQAPISKPRDGLPVRLERLV